MSALKDKVVFRNTSFMSSRVEQRGKPDLNRQKLTETENGNKKKRESNREIAIEPETEMKVRVGLAILN